MKQISLLALLLIFNFACKNEDVEEIITSTDNVALVDFVNPLMGTDSEFSLSNGNTYPAIATPWGMNFWTPMTSRMGDGWTYKYDEYKIRGIKQTHQPSPWINDYAAFSLMAMTGKLEVDEEKRGSWFSHKAETVKPYHYSVYLADYDVTAELSPTERAAHFKFTFPESDSSYVLLDGFFRGSMVKIIPEENKIIGYCRNNSGGVPDNFHNYFVAVFDKDFEFTKTFSVKEKEGDQMRRKVKDWQVMDSAFAEGEHVGAVIGFKTQKGEEVHVKVASSFISPEQAELTLFREIGEDSFEITRSNAKDAWERELQRIKVEDNNIDNVRTFYSSLYRVLLFPRKFYEINEQEEVVHYSPYNGEVLPGYMFTDNGFWDTFRAVFPFFNMMYPELNSHIMQGLANTYRESGWLPEWASPGHRQSMIGSNSAVNIADAFMKGNAGGEEEILLEAMLKNATVEEGRPQQSVGRAGVDYYNKLGYIPYDIGLNENTARTLEYAFADFAIAKMAEKMGKQDVAEKYFKQSLNYRNVFDSTSNLMRGKNEDGTFQSPFNPLKWGDAFTEGNSLHYTWSVFHDVQGLIELMGGNENFVSQLDAVFEMPPEFDDSYYGFPIHEIREMQIANMGNYAHGNQPIQHMIYLYNHGGEPHKAQYWVRQVLDRMYSATPDGYCGDEDNGQTSAWYVFSSMGFYPVTPVSDQYVIGSPLFDKVTMKLQNGNEFVISTEGNGKDSYYIESAALNGESYNKTFLNYDDIQKGGKLLFKMRTVPSTWGGEAGSVPFSMSK